MQDQHQNLSRSIRFLLSFFGCFVVFFKKSAISIWITNFEQSGLDTVYVSFYFSTSRNTVWIQKKTPKNSSINFCSNFTILNCITYYQDSCLQEYLSAMLASFMRSKHGHLHVNHFFFPKENFSVVFFHLQF